MARVIPVISTEVTPLMEGIQPVINNNHGHNCKVTDRFLNPWPPPKRPWCPSGVPPGVCADAALFSMAIVACQDEVDGRRW